MKEHLNKLGNVHSGQDETLSQHITLTAHFSGTKIALQ